MKIGIIGAGQIGGTLTRRLRSLGHEVYVANSRGPETLHDLAKESGAMAVSAKEAARSGEIVIITIPERNVPKLPKDLFAGVPDKVVVVDTGNYYPQQRDGRIAEIEAGLPESRWVERQIGRPVVKVFNNIYARHLLELGRPAGTATRIALPVAGDDPTAKEIIMRLVDDLGFDPVDAGGLDESCGNNRVLRSMPLTSTPGVSAARYRKQPGNGLRSFKPPTKVLAITPNLPRSRCGGCPISRAPLCAGNGV